MKTGLFTFDGHEIQVGDKIKIYEVSISDPALPLQRIFRGGDVVYTTFVGWVACDEEGQDFELQDEAGNCIIGIPRHDQTYELTP